MTPRGGDKLGPYEILALIGAGGMGAVYKARDSRLNRLVAIKILSANLLAESVRKQRFIQEAQAASALNHANIVTIYDINQHDGTDYMVMEYIDGKTLDAVIPRNGMALGELLRIAIEIASGLAKAHSAGIIHRDLKPSNIIVAEDGGRVKILDFGLAKLTENVELGENDQTLKASPATEEGTIVGTVTYMSPEQAEGRKVDVRSDIFSFGSVLYEMITGQRAFRGKSRLETLSAILKEEPAPVTNAPAELERILRRCMRKDREKRFQHMDDVKVALDEIREDSESGRLVAAVHAAGQSGPRSLWLVAAALLVAAGGAAGWFVLRQPATPEVSSGPAMRQLTFDPGLTQEPTLWPAGNMIAYSSDRAGDNLDIWVQHLETKDARRLTTHQADDREPAFSPDGSRIAFRSERDGGGIYVVSALGGEERRIADGGRGPRFSPDGKWIAYYAGQSRGDLPFAFTSPGLYVVEATGGSPRQIAKDFFAVSQPVWSPESRSVLFMGGPELGIIDWWVASADGGKPVKTGAISAFKARKLAGRDPRGWDGEFVYFLADFADSRNVWKVRIAPNSYQVTEAPERVTYGNGQDAQPWVSQGRVLFTSMVENSDIWSLPVDTGSGKVMGEPKRITTGVTQEYNSDVSRNGRFVVFISQRGSGTEVIWKDLESGQERTVTSFAVPGRAPSPTISPDGSRVAVNTVAGARIVQIFNAAGGSPKTACEDCISRNWATDGRRLVITRATKSTGLVDPETGTTNLFLTTSYLPFAPRMLPGDRWIVWYTGIANDRSRMFIAPVKEDIVSEKEWISVTDGSSWDVLPSFSEDGSILYFQSQRDGFRCFWATKLDGETKKPAGQPYPVYHLHSARRSPGYVRTGMIASQAARDKIVFTMAERTGNIWMAEPRAK